MHFSFPAFTKRILVAALILGSILPVSSQASILDFKKSDTGIHCKLDHGSLDLQVCTDTIIHVRYTVLDQFPEKKSLVVNNPWSNTPAFDVSDDPKEITISTSKLIVKIDRSTEQIRYYNKKGELIVSESQKDGKKMISSFADRMSTYICETLFDSPLGEGLFGLGCHARDPLSVNYQGKDPAQLINYKGRDQVMKIKYLDGAIPVLLSTRGYGLLWDNYSPSSFSGTVANNTQFRYTSDSGKMVDYYFLYGPEFDQIIAGYRRATGAAPLFPKWAFGLIQSKDRYGSQKEILDVAKTYRQDNIPLDCLVQDWMYWTLIGSFQMVPNAYPDPKAMLYELHAENIHGMISIWPVYQFGTANYLAMEAGGYLLPMLALHETDCYYDAFSDKAREMYWNQLSKSLIIPNGWDAIWADNCEPESSGFYPKTGGTEIRKVFNTPLGRGLDVFNVYSLLHTGGLYDHWRQDIPNKRVFTLARQAFAGQQRFGACLWSGDVFTTWDDFRIQVSQGINTCVSGYPYWTTDIGGYRRCPKVTPLQKVTASNPTEVPEWSHPVNRELFTRWFQFGAFCPVFRIHGPGNRALYSDSWDQKTKQILLDYDNLRYRLMPYIYSLAWKVTDEGYTMMRSLAFDFRKDPQIKSIPDEYMFGPAFLVSPIVQPMENITVAPDAIRQWNLTGSTTKSVYLPTDTLWYNFWTGEQIQGGSTLTNSVTMEKIPIHMKAGSIVPMGPVVQYADQPFDAPVELRIYPGADGSFTIYEDDGKTYNYEKKARSTFTLSWNDHDRTLSISERVGDFDGVKKSWKFHIVLVRLSHGVGIAEEQHPDKSISYEGQPIKVSL